MKFLNKALIVLSVAAFGGCTGGGGDDTGAAADKSAPEANAMAESRIFPTAYVMRDLPNGLRVIVVPTDYPDVVNLQIPVQTGSRNEIEPGRSGFAHFFEHMMFRGTEQYPPERYGAIMKKAGADQNAYTTDDYTNYHTTFTKSDLETVLKLEADRFQNLSYTKTQFRTEALAVKGEYLKNYSNPIQKILEVMRDNAFTRHPYKHTTMGFFADIQNMPEEFDYSREFFRRWYRPENTTIILTGDVEPEHAVALVKQYWGDWKPGDFKAAIPAEAPPQGPVYKHIKWDAPTQPWVVVAFHGPAFRATDKAKPAMDLVGQIYFSQSSDIYQKLVTDQQIADNLFYYFPDREDPQLLYIGARLNDAARAQAVTDEILATAARARTELVDGDRLDDTKSHLKYTFAAQLDNSEAIGDVLARYVHFRRTPETINQLYRTYDSLQPEDLKHYADEYLTDGNRVIVALSNDAEIPGMATLPSVDNLAAAATDTTSAADVETVAMPGDAPLVDVSWVFHTGAALDPPGKKGLAALTAAMISDGGSSLHSIREIRQAMFPMAAGFTAQVDKEMTRLAGEVHRDNLAGWYKLVAEQLYQPGFREDDFKRIKQQLVNAVQTDLKGNNDEELGKEALYRFVYGPGHPYASYDLGAASDLQALTLDDVKAFYAKYYTPQNVTLGLAGGYPADFASQVTSDVGRLSVGERTKIQVPPAPAFAGRQAQIIQKETPAVAVSFGFPIDVVRGDKDWVALWLVRSWLGEHRNSNSHLYQRIREVRGMNYGDYAYIEYFPRGMFQFHPDANLGRQRQIFQVWLRPLRNNNDAQFATRVALRELDKLVTDGMSREDFEATRSFLGKFVSLLVKSQSRQLGYAIDSRYYGIGNFTDYVRKGLAALTLEDVNRAIRTHLQTDNVKFVFVTRDAGDLEKRLVSDQPSPITYNSPKPDELLAEDKAIQAMPMGFSKDHVTIVPVEKVFQ
ncbi:MAG: pitrilysin family protein [Gammaproteobacteria bacterium]|jgi:zinc protease